MNICITSLLLLSLLISHPALAAAADPGEAEIEAVMGAQTQVKRTAPGTYIVDGEPVTLAQLLATTLPQRETTLKGMQDSIKQRMDAQIQATSGLSLDAKRGQCQHFAVNSIDRTRCYQELEAMRDSANTSVQDRDSQHKDDQLQSDRLQQEIDAIEQFRQEYGAK